jgi:hypothetical protein
MTLLPQIVSARCKIKGARLESCAFAGFMVIIKVLNLEIIFETI